MFKNKYYCVMWPRGTRGKPYECNTLITNTRILVTPIEHTENKIIAQKSGFFENEVLDLDAPSKRSSKPAVCPPPQLLAPR